MARELYHTVGHPSIQDYKIIINMNAIKIFFVAIEDMDIYEKIFGTNIYTLTGNTVRTKTKSVVNEYIDNPQELKDAHKNFDICTNIMYIQRRMSPVVISTTIKFIEIQDITESKIPILNKAFDSTLIVYNQSGLQIQIIRVYTEFKPMEGTFKDIDIMINYATVK